MVSAGQHRVATGGPDGLDNRILGGGNNHRSDVRFHRPAPDVNDHRLAANFGQWLARKA